MKRLLRKIGFRIKGARGEKPADFKHADKEERQRIMHEEAKVFAKRYGKVIEALSKE